MGWGAQQAATAAGQCDAADSADAALAPFHASSLAALQALCAIARFHHVAADPEPLAHQPGLQRNEDVGASEPLPADPRAVAPSPAREPEAIHRSLTGGTLTVLTDVLFSVFFISVALFYSVPFVSLFR